jgi:hypothetical protein
VRGITRAHVCRERVRKGDGRIAVAGSAGELVEAGVGIAKLADLVGLDHAKPVATAAPTAPAHVIGAGVVDRAGLGTRVRHAWPYTGARRQAVAESVVKRHLHEIEHPAVPEKRI